jgi:glycosyltransferase involved in cell wall biosynthesis
MVKNNPTITIAIPSYNKAPYIKRCIESILCEKDLVDQIILVDNASTDNTFEIAKEFSEFVKCYKNDSNLGMSGNWNKCIELCQTDLLMIFHADDELIKGSISKYLDFFSKNSRVGLVHADAIFVKNGNYNSSVYQKTDTKMFRKAGEEAVDLPGNYCSTVVVKKDVYSHLGEFMLKSCASDIEMWRRIGSKYDIGYIDEATAYYHSNKDSYGAVSLVTRTIEEILSDWESINKRVISYYPEAVRDQKKKQLAYVAREQLANGLFAVLVANIKAKKISNIFKILKIMIFKYGCFFLLINLSFKNLIYLFKKRLSYYKK